MARLLVVVGHSWGGNGLLLDWSASVSLATSSFEAAKASGLRIMQDKLQSPAAFNELRSSGQS